MRILVTGDRGFVGMATVAELEQAGHEVHGFDIMAGGDIRDADDFAEDVERVQPDRILHLAAVARFADADADPRLAHATNVVGSQNVASAAATYHVPVVYASTGSVYMPISQEPPITEDFPAAGNSIYGCTKLLGELYIQAADVPSIVLRYSHLYGAEKRMHGLISGFIDRIERGLAPRLYGGAQSNDFCYVDDIARANRLALEAPWDCWGQVYNIGTGEELSAEDAGRAVCDAWGYDGAVEVLTGRPYDAPRFVYDTSKAERLLGFRAQYTFAEGLAAMASIERLTNGVTDLTMIRSTTSTGMVEAVS